MLISGASFTASIYIVNWPLLEDKFPSLTLYSIISIPLLFSNGVYVACNPDTSKLPRDGLFKINIINSSVELSISETSNEKLIPLESSRIFNSTSIAIGLSLTAFTVTEKLWSIINSPSDTLTFITASPDHSASGINETSAPLISTVPNPLNNSAVYNKSSESISVALMLMSSIASSSIIWLEINVNSGLSFTGNTFKTNEISSDKNKSVTNASTEINP